MTRPFAFAVGARVRLRGKSGKAGVVMRCQRHTNGSPRYVVAWDNDPEGSYLVWEADLISQPETNQ